MSAETFTIALTPRGQSAYANLQSFPARMLPAIARGLDAALEEALDQTLKKRFTGKGPFDPALKKLGVRSGLLRTSFLRSPARAEGGSVRASIGSNVKYWFIHEFGFNGQVAVNAHSRAHTIDERGNVVAHRRALRSKKVHTLRTSQVRAHTRWLQMPERAPMRTGLREQLPRMGEIVSATLVGEWNRGGSASSLANPANPV